MNNDKPIYRWNDADRQNYSDRNILKAQRIPNKKRIANRNACRKKAWND